MDKILSDTRQLACGYSSALLYKFSLLRKRPLYFFPIDFGLLNTKMNFKKFSSN